MNNEELFEKIKRNAANIYSEDGLRKKLSSSRRLIIKLGADPSAPDLHLGHSVVLRQLKLLQQAGHEIVFVIGDFTGMIGDPSGKKKAREPLSFEQTRENGQTYFKQVTKILSPEKTVITYNSQWFSKMTFSEVMALAGKYTLARILERDDFSNRFNENQPISIQELFYPLMQGYDSVALGADIEVGGTDQTFNLLVGRELQRDYGQSPQEVITFPLLPGLDGVEKMSKSLGNFIGIDEPADIMFEKCMKIPDEVLLDYFRLTTDIDLINAQSLINHDVRNAHALYADTLTSMYHNKASADNAKDRYFAVASGKTPGRLDEIFLPKGTYPVWKLVVLSGLATSGGEARRLAAQGGITLNGEKALDPTIDRLFDDEVLMKRGKSRYVKIRFI